MGIVVGVIAILIFFITRGSDSSKSVQGKAAVAQTKQSAPVPAQQYEQKIQAQSEQPQQQPAQVQQSASQSNEINYCLTEETRKQLSQTEKPFIQKQLKSRVLDAKDTSVHFNTKETADSMGGPEFKCIGKVTVVSKSANAQVLSYDIRYTIFMDEGFVGVDPKKISRANIEPPLSAAERELEIQEAEKRKAEVKAKQEADAARARENKARREAEMRKQQEAQARKQREAKVKSLF